MKKLIVLLLICLSICPIIGCEKHINLEKEAALVTEGMSYAEIKDLLGDPGVDVGSGIAIYEWQISKNKTLRVAMKKTPDEAAVYPEDYIATRIEILENES